VDSTLTLLLVAIGGAALGALVAWLLASRQIAGLTARAITAEARLTAAEQGEQRLREAFASLSRDALRTNSDEFISRAKTDLGSLVDPLKTALTEQQRRVDELERERQKAYGSIEQMLQRMTADQQQLQSETARLVKSLRQPQVRGRWGEIQLRQVVELAGMSHLCDFVEQQNIADDEGGRQRPDLQVRLPNQRVIVIDAKVPLSAYLDAIECEDDGERANWLKQHARQVRDHVTDMGRRAYQQKIDGAYDFLVLFIPGEVFYRAAVEHDGNLLEYAFQKGVIITTPSTLIALLKAVALGWREARLAEDARKIRDEGERLYKALGTLAGYVNDLGKALGKSVTHYNSVIGNMETTLFRSAKRLREMEVSSAPLEDPQLVEEPLRAFSRDELLQEALPDHRSFTGREEPGS
jgi:DNA recombination protein RmuC